MHAATAHRSPDAESACPLELTTGGPSNANADQQGKLPHGLNVAIGSGSSTHCFKMDNGVASRNKTGISIVVDIENSASPTVVTRQFSGPPTATTVHLEGSAKKNSLVNEVVAFGGIAAPSLPVHASDMIRAQPNADATQMERAMQNVNLRHDFSSPGNGKFKHSFASLTTEDILSKASSIGISLGKNKKEALEAAVSIKEVDVNRTLMI
jgi:hypothetical protein